MNEERIMTSCPRWIAAIFTVAILFASNPSFAADDLPKITVKEAYDMVVAAYSRNGSPTHLSIGVLTPAEKDGFYHVETVPTEPDTEGTGPTLAVNVWTGDVWDIKFCADLPAPHITSRAARKLQLAIKTRLGLSEKAYLKLARRRPECTFP